MRAALKFRQTDTFHFSAVLLIDTQKRCQAKKQPGPDRVWLM